MMGAGRACSFRSSPSLHQVPMGPSTASLTMLGLQLLTSTSSTVKRMSPCQLRSLAPHARRQACNQLHPRQHRRGVGEEVVDSVPRATPGIVDLLEVDADPTLAHEVLVPVPTYRRFLHPKQSDQSACTPPHARRQPGSARSRPGCPQPQLCLAG